MTANVKIRVAHICEATTGGTRRHLVDLVTHLEPEAFAVTVICSTFRDPAFLGDIEAMRGRGIEVTVVPMRRDIRPFADFAAFRQLRRALGEGRFDIVHTHSSKAGFLGRLAARRAGVPLIVHTSHVFPFLMDISPARKRLYAGLERWTGSFTDRIVCVCAEERNAALENRVAVADRLEVIENGVDTAEIDRAVSDGAASAVRRRLPAGPDDLVVGVVGRFAPQKGHGYFVRAAARVLETLPRTRFLLVGDGELRARTEAMMESLGVADRFSVVRHTEDIYSHLAALDLFVLPSLWEGLPYSLLEAMALRKAVVATRVGGVGEVVVPDETGILVPPRDAQALANAMIALLLNPARRATLGQCGRERVEQRFRREEMIACVERLYHELRASSRRGRASPNARRRVSRALPRRA